MGFNYGVLQLRATKLKIYRIKVLRNIVVLTYLHRDLKILTVKGEIKRFSVKYEKDATPIYI